MCQHWKRAASLLVAFSALPFYSHNCKKLVIHELLATFWLSSGQQLHLVCTTSSVCQHLKRGCKSAVDLFSTCIFSLIVVQIGNAWSPGQHSVLIWLLSGQQLHEWFKYCNWLIGTVFNCNWCSNFARQLNIMSACQHLNEQCKSAGGLLSTCIFG